MLGCFQKIELVDGLFSWLCLHCCCVQLLVIKVVLNSVRKLVFRNNRVVSLDIDEAPSNVYWIEETHISSGDFRVQRWQLIYFSHSNPIFCVCRESLMVLSYSY